MSPRKKKLIVTEEPILKRTETPVGERLYEMLGEGDMKVIIGPHEGFVDTLGLPPESATRLHNILYRRKLYNYAQAAKHPQDVQGAIQELYQLDVQTLLEKMYRFELETPEGG